MTHRVALSARAERDRDDAFAWYEANYSREFAIRWYNGVSHAISSLQQNPSRCGLAREDAKFPFELRELSFGGRYQRHRILFRIQGELVFVLHVRHSSRQDLTDDDL